MGVKYNGNRLVWLKQYAGKGTQLEWESPDAGALGEFAGGASITIPVKVKVRGNGKLVYSISSGMIPPGLTIDTEKGTIFGNVENVTDSYEFTLRAEAGGTAIERTFSMNIVANEAPVWQTNAGSLGSGFDGSQFEAQLTAIDPEGKPVTYTVTAGSLPQSLKLDEETGVISGRLSPVPSNLTFFFTVSASDGLLSTPRAFSITNKHNDQPVWQTGYDLPSALESEVYNLQLVATDAGGGSALTYTMTGTLPPGLSMSNTGLISGTVTDGSQNGAFPNPNIYQFTVRATDGIAAVERRFRLPTYRNVAPVFRKTGLVYTGIGGSNFSFLIDAYDPNGRPLTYSEGETPLPNGVTLDTVVGALSGVLPLESEDTDFVFDIVASDGHNSTEASLTIRSLVNTAPVWTTNAVLLPVIEGIAFSRPLVATDAQGKPVTYTALTPPPAGVLLNANTGVLTGATESVTEDTDYTFTIQASDGVLTSNREFTLTVKKNVPPVWVTAAGSLGTELGLRQMPTSVKLEATDANEQAVSFSVVGGALPNGISLNSNGSFSGALPNPASTTTYNFTVAASDGVNSTSRSFSYTVEPNTAPVWITPAGSLGAQFESTTFTKKLEATDAEGKPVRFYTKGGQLPVALQSDGTLIGTLAHVEQDATYTFTVYAFDGELETPRTFSITTLFNSPPVFLTAPTLGTLINGVSTTLQLQATGVGNGPMVYSIVSGALPEGMSMTSAGRITGTPTVDGEATFTVRAFNGIKDATRTFTWNVSTNVAPAWNTATGTLGSVYAGNAFNYQLSATDANGQAVTYTLESGSLPAGLQLTAGGLITGTPTVVATDTMSNFTIRASDGLLSNDRVFSITIFGNASPNWITPAGSLGYAIKLKAYSIALSASDPENRPLTYSLVSGTIPGGNVSQSGVITGKAPNVTQGTSYEFTIRVSDGVNHVDRTFSYEVRTDSPPVWNTNAGLIGSVLGGYDGGYSVSATDPEGLGITYSFVSGTIPPGWTNNISSAGGHTSASDNDITYTFTIRASDGLTEVDRTFSYVILKNLAPVWNTASGELFDQDEGTVVNLSVSATDPEGEDIVYSVGSGTFPPGLFLNPTTGAITGTIGTVTEDTTYNFAIRASDGKRYSDQPFTAKVKFNSPPIWSTASGSLGSGKESTSFSATLLASAFQQTVTYSLAPSSTLPTGLTLNSTTGAITGSLPLVSSNTTFNFTIRATSTETGKYADRAFSITVQDNRAPLWQTSATNLITDLAGTAVNITLVATDADGDAVSYEFIDGALPETITFDANTGVLSGTLPSVSQDTTYTFTIGAFDGTVRNDKEFTITSQFDTAPVWTSNAALGSFLELTSIARRLQASDDQGKTITYSFVDGNLPGTMTYTANATGAYINGSAPVYTNNANNTVLLHGEGGEGGTTVTESTGNLALTASSGVITSTAQKKFGGSSIYFPGQDAQLLRTDATSPTAVAFGSGDFTMEAWIYPQGLNMYTGGIWMATLGSSSGAGTNNSPGNWIWRLVGTSATAITQMAFQAYDSGGTVSVDLSANMSVSLNQWHHVAISRSGSNLYFFLDGALAGTGNIGATALLNKANSYFSIGCHPITGYPLVFKGYIDEYRVLKGQAAYTGNFTVPSVPFGNSYEFTLRASDGSKSTDRTFYFDVLDNTAPVWTTASGSLGNVTEGQTFNYQLAATDPEGNALTYTMANSTLLPNGLNLSSAGLISGTAMPVGSDITTNFSVRVSDGLNSTDRSFSITVLNDTQYLDTASDLVVLQMNMDGTENTRSYYDARGHTVEAVDFTKTVVWLRGTDFVNQQDRNDVSIMAGAVAGVTAATGTSKSGLGSYNFNAAGRYIRLDVAQGYLPGSVTDSPLYIGTSDFTIEGWFNFANRSGNQNLWCYGSYTTDATNGSGHIVQYQNGVGLVVYVADGTIKMTVPYTPASTWDHIALVRASGVWTIYVNGVSRATYTNANAQSFSATTNNGFMIGNANYATSTNYIGGYIEDFRFSKTAIYNGNFTANSLTRRDEGPVISTSSKFGSGAVVLANQQAVIVPHSSDFVFHSSTVGSSNWTVEFWAYPTDTTSVGTVISKGHATTLTPFRIFKNGANWSFVVNFQGGGGASGITQNFGSVVPNQWQHIALVMERTASALNFHAYVNGVRQGSPTLSTGAAVVLTNSTAPLRIGGLPFVTTGSFLGSIDDLRVTCGVARYTGANYTVPSQALAPPPEWATPAGAISTASEQTTFSTSVVATDPFGTGYLSYAIVSGSLPSNTTLDAISGAISGQMPIATGLPWSVTMKATDGNGNKTGSRVFQLAPKLEAPSSLKYSWRLSYQTNGLNTASLFDSSVGGLATTAVGTAPVTAAATGRTGDTALSIGGSMATGVPDTATGNTLASVLQGDFTWECWFYHTSTSGSNPTGFSFSNGAQSGNAFRFAFNNVSGTNRWHIIYNGTGAATAATGWTMTANNWHHIAITRQSATNTMVIFVDGVQVATFTAAALTAPITRWTIGSYNFEGTYVTPAGTQIRAINLYNTIKYSGTFTPQWNSFLDPLWTTTALNGGIDNETYTETLSATTVGNATAVYSLLSSTGNTAVTVSNAGVVSATLTSSLDATSINVGLSDSKNNVGQSRTFTVQPGDVYYDNTVVIAHADNTTNHSASGLTLSLGSGASINTTVKKFGAGSFALNGTINGFARTSVLPASMAFGTRNWTIEQWVNLNGFVLSGGIYNASIWTMGRVGGGNTGNALGLFISPSSGATGNGTTIGMNAWSSTQTNVQLPGGNAQWADLDLALNQWHHIAVCRDGGNVNLFVNGVHIGSRAFTASISYQTNYFMTWGILSSTVGYEYPLSGYIDDARVTMDVARYATSFTLPTVPHQNTRRV